MVDDLKGRSPVIRIAKTRCQVQHLAGRGLRLPGTDPQRIESILEDAGIAGTVAVEPATLEEAMVLAATPEP